MGKVLQIAPIAPPDLQAELEARFDVHRYWEAGLPANPATVTAVASRGDVGCSGEIIAALPNLSLIAVYGVGFDAIDLAACRARKVAVTTTPGVLTDAVAELAVALTLAAARRVTEGDRFVRAGRWRDGEFGLGFSLAGTTIGIFGYGRIGRRAATLFRAFDAKILYCDLAPVAGEEAAFRPTPLALARDCRVLVVTAAGGAATEGLVGREVMVSLGSTGVLVNVARGSVVDEVALCQMLASGTLGAAAVDVFMDEPSVPEALIRSDRVVLTPHIASGAIQTREAMARLVIDNLHAHATGAPLKTPLRLP